jgi:glycogen debranching enzyme
MKYTLHENLHNRNGVISNLHGFINRHLDTGFKSKWSGFWVPPYKYMDYYGIKVNGTWLGPESLEATEYGDQLDYYHSTDTLQIRETVRTPSDVPGFVIELEMENEMDSPKAVHIAAEIGVDIRSKSQDIGPENYDVEEYNDKFKVIRENRFLEVSSETDFDLMNGPYIREHYPDELQKCLVPGEMVFRTELEPGETETIEIVFETDRPVTGELEEIEQEFRHEDLSRAFNDSIESMDNLIYDRENIGIIAGHPWFQSYWARDSFWTLLGMIDAGRFDTAREILENYAENPSGKINLADETEEDFPRSDTYPLFIIAADKLRRHDKINDKIEEAMEELMNEVEIDDGIVQHEAMGTWMDTLERPLAVDIQSLWLKAAEIMEDERVDELADGLERFENGRYVKDFISEDSPKTINPTVPLMFDQFDQKNGSRYLSKINAEFSSRYGARTRSMADPGYESDGYHNGSVWGLTTGWAAAANLQYGKEKQGLNFLEKLAGRLDHNQPGALPEVVDAEKGHLLGCPEQAWSAGMMVHVVDTYLLGVKVNEDKVVIDPAEDINCELREKLIGDEKIRFKVEKGEPELLNDPEIEVELC